MLNPDYCYIVITQEKKLSLEEGRGIGGGMGLFARGLPVLGDS